MALRNIVVEGDPILKKVCRPVTNFDASDIDMGLSLLPGYYNGKQHRCNKNSFRNINVHNADRCLDCKSNCKKDSVLIKNPHPSGAEYFYS